MRVLVVNAGSSSLKLRVLDQDETLIASVDIRTPGGEVDEQVVGETVTGLGKVDAVGHRIVHGGIEFVDPVLINADITARLRALTDLAPLHQPKSLAALDAVTRVLPDVPAVVCFDTAFHAEMPAAAATYALPVECRKRWNLRRFGFHGLSHAYASRRAAEILGQRDLRVVTCHLGAGASLAAVRGGRSVDTTMGFTPLEGLVMGTRSGSVDPGLVLWLEEHVGTPTAELAATLEHRSGLLGLAGTADMAVVVKRAEAGNPDANLALNVYLHRLRAGIAAMASSLDGMDALVFTGGVGENAPVVQRRACEGLSFLGVAVDGEREEEGTGDREIGSSPSDVKVLVVVSREDIEITRQVRQILMTPPAK